MKKITAIILCVALVLSGFLGINLKTVKAESKEYNLIFGKQITAKFQGTSQSSNFHGYKFNLGSNTNIRVSISSKSGSVRWGIATDKVAYQGYTYAPSDTSVYLPKGNGYYLLINGTGEYTFKVTNEGASKVKFPKSSGKFKDVYSVSIPFTYTGAYKYANTNLKMKNSKPKMASASMSLYSDNTGTVTVYPKRYGKTVISLVMAGGNTAKYTFHVTRGYWYIAKGYKKKAPKPVGVKKPKWSSSKKKRLSIKKKTGKVKAKKGGRVTITAKKGKVKYRLKTVVTDFKKLARQSYKEIRLAVNNPDKLKVYEAYRGYAKVKADAPRIPVVYFDFGSTNYYGAMIRTKLIAYYDEVMTIRSTKVDSSNVVYKKKVMKKKYYKK
ncbi:MAG: hypothetical protein K6E58_00905 [Eubacterium sp.]|nr:hypothetical protein [Eubacterium sp.]